MNIWEFGKAWDAAFEEFLDRDDHDDWRRWLLASELGIDRELLEFLDQIAKRANQVRTDISRKQDLDSLRYILGLEAKPGRHSDLEALRQADRGSRALNVILYEKFVKGDNLTGAKAAAAVKLDVETATVERLIKKVSHRWSDWHMDRRKYDAADES